MRNLTFAFLILSSAAWAGTQMSTTREGTYHVRLECRDPDPKLCEKLAGPHTLTLMNIQTRYEAVVTIRPQMGRPTLYSFASTEIKDDGYTMHGGWVEDYPIAEIQLNLTDPDSDVLGWIRDPRFTNDIRIRGRQYASTYGYFEVSDGDPLPLSDVLGRFSGTVDGKDATLVIQKSLVGPWLMATLRIGMLLTYKFQEGLIDDNQRVVMLWRAEDDKRPFEKLILPLESRDGDITTDGVSFLGTSGKFSRVLLQKD